MTPSPRTRRTSRTIACVAAVVAVASTAGALLLAPGASGDRDPRVDTRKLSARTVARARMTRSIDALPLARRGACPSTGVVPGVGAACRTADGMLVLPKDGQPALMTHGPDLVDATPSEAAADGGFGTTDSILCSAPGSSRHVVLAYLLPSDFATPGAPAVHGDRSAEVLPQLRQAYLDAAATVDRRAGELAPGQRRRMRTACGADGQPIVERIVLPRTAAAYLDPSTGGFSAIESDLGELGYLPDYDDFSVRHVPSVKRVLAYYDADFQQGVAGQGVMFRRTSMLAQGARANDPLVSRTTRNINNNPPNATFALQYGTSYGGVPDPPLYTSLLHELSHTMGAVQDEPPTASDAGHCLDGLDVMCYDDGGPGGSYDATRCTDPTPGTVDAADEQYDCNGDTYFHPAPPSTNPLSGPTTWHLGLPANEQLATFAPSAPPGAVGAVTVAGRGTRLVLRWPKVPNARGYAVGFRPSGGTWSWIAVRATTAPPVATPSLRARSDYEFVVQAHDVRAVTGPAATAARRTGVDTSPPTAPGRPSLVALTRTSLQLGFTAGIDNERTARYVVEQRIGTRWSMLTSFPAPTTTSASNVRGPRITRLRAGTTYVLRLRAVDVRGNRSSPSASSSFTTRR